MKNQHEMGRERIDKNEVLIRCIIIWSLQFDFSESWKSIVIKYPKKLLQEQLTLAQDEV